MGISSKKMDQPMGGLDLKIRMTLFLEKSQRPIGIQVLKILTNERKIRVVLYER